MANIVSELFISLGLDSSNFSKGMDDAEKKMGQMGETSKRVGDDLRKGITFSLGEVVKAAFPLLGVTASVMSLVNAQQSLYNIQKASKETGIPAREYAAWGRAAESLGYSAQDAQGSLASLQSALQEAALTGRSQAAGVLTYLGVGLFKANGQMKSATEVLKDLSRVMSRLPIEKARIYGQMMGLSPSDCGTCQSVGKRHYRRTGKACLGNAESLEPTQAIRHGFGLRRSSNASASN